MQNKQYKAAEAAHVLAAHMRVLDESDRGYAVGAHATARAAVPGDATSVTADSVPDDAAVKLSEVRAFKANIREQSPDLVMTVERRCEVEMRVPTSGSPSTLTWSFCTDEYVNVISKHALTKTCHACSLGHWLPCHSWVRPGRRSWVRPGCRSWVRSGCHSFAIPFCTAESS
jgi:hypothetical protein